MAVFRCKMCGGILEFKQGETVGVCDSCGTKQTLPRLDDERRVNLYDRANHFRRNNEFDKASGIYEQILMDDKTDAEAYWSLVLCRYGIEYVEDPSTHKRVPTINRAQYTSIFEDDNYKSALQYADISQKILYEEEAATINDIQKGILAISQKEEPFDIFICYKETDQNGRRTPDSVLANDMYHQLTTEGFKVFFSRITLEDKLGIAYEPYIFAALNSAKVMVVLGTKAEYFNAVWVKNEWSRYLTIVKQSGGKKVLIPAYRDMDPYDLPEEFSHLQAQDMSKLGFMQDLIRGVKKIVSMNEPQTTVKETVVVNTGNTNFDPLLRRAFLFLEDCEWEKADEYCEQVLNMEPENAQAYIGKLMAELRVQYQEELADCEKPFDDSNNYQKAIRFGDDETVEKLKDYNNTVKQQLEFGRKNCIYDEAVEIMNAADDEKQYKKAAAIFQKIPGHRDADACAKDCLEYAEACRKDDIYFKANVLMNSGKIKDYESAIALFQTIEGWKDTNENIRFCQNKTEEIYDTSYHQAKDMMYEADSEACYKEAAKKFQTISGYLDADALATQCFEYAETSRKNEIYNKGISQMVGEDEEKYQSAIKLFQSIRGWKDADDKIIFCQIKIDEIKKTKELELQEHNRKIAETQKKRKKRKRIIIIASVVLCVTLVTIIVLLKYKIIPEIEYNRNYRRAQENIENGEYLEAIEILKKLEKREEEQDVKRMYIDSLVSQQKYDEAVEYGISNNSLSDDEISEIWDLKYESKVKEGVENGKYDALINANIGDVVTFGSLDEETPIEWLVLDKTKDDMLIIANQPIDRLGKSDMDGTNWSDSKIRELLNSNYYQEKMSLLDEEYYLIKDTRHLSYYNQYVQWEKDKYRWEEFSVETEEKIFLLNEKEVELYFPDPDLRSDSKHMGNWALRDMESDNWLSVYVNGEIGVRRIKKLVIRPALYIDLSILSKYQN